MGHTSSNKNVTNGIWQKVAVATMMVTILFFASKEIKESLRLLEDTEHPADLENPKDFRLMKGLFFAPPCGHNNVRYEVVSHPAYGKLCLEKLEHGNELIKDWLRKGFVWEKDLIPYFEKHIRNDSVVIDVGAHIGLHTLLFSNLVGDKGKVLAFEPNLKIFQELLANIYINGPQNIFAEFVALGSQKSLVNMEPTFR